MGEHEREANSNIKETRCYENLDIGHGAIFLLTNYEGHSFKSSVPKFRLMICTSLHTLLHFSHKRLSGLPREKIK